MEKWVVGMSNKVILVTEWSKYAFIHRYPGVPMEKFVLIPNGCDLADFTRVKSLPTAPRNPTFTIVHAGAMNDSKVWGRNPAGLFRAVHSLLTEEPELSEKLTVVFAGDLPEVHRRLADEMGLSGVIKGIGHLPHDKVLHLIKSADLLLAINYENWSTIIPAKIYEYWAAGGSPILLLSCRGAAADLVKRHNLGFTVDHDDAEGIHAAILNVYRQRETATRLQVSTAGIEQYDRQALTRKLARVLSMIT
jgi:glycosyltransferase involved in cell wall biosynthesis